MSLSSHRGKDIIVHPWPNLFLRGWAQSLSSQVSKLWVDLRSPESRRCMQECLARVPAPPPALLYHGRTAMQITELLQRVHAGDPQALHTVIPLVYDELKRLAAGHLRHEGKARPLDTTALVHEAFLRLAHGQHPPYENR